jgi:hypothetical protein
MKALRIKALAMHFGYAESTRASSRGRIEPSTSDA